MSPRPRLSSTEILAALVSHDTTSRHSNLELIGWIRTYLEGWDVHVRESRNASGDKANLHVVIGPVQPGGIALSGHVDTVPVDGQSWNSDPFRLTERDGRLFARGATDMKGFVACMLAAVPDLVSARRRLPVHLLITFDEETDCAGAHRLVDDLAESGLLPATCIVGEPSSLGPITAHKGRLSVGVSVRGLAAHSSDPRRGVNALHEAARAVAWLAEDADRLAAHGPRVDGFDPPWTTTQVGVLSGGSILNIVPDAARFELEWRTVPGEDWHALLARMEAHVERTIAPRMRAVDPSCGFAFEILNELPPLSLPDAHPFAALVGIASGTGSNRPGKVSYGTEAGIFQAAGIAAMVCGPGDIGRAHKPDEWIGTEELDACDRFLRRAVEMAERDPVASGSAGRAGSAAGG